MTTPPLSGTPLVLAAALVRRAAHAGRRAREIPRGVLIRLVRGVVLVLAARERIRTAPDLVASEAQAQRRLSRRLVDLQQGLCDLEGLGEQHGCVVP